MTQGWIVFIASLSHIEWGEKSRAETGRKGMSGRHSKEIRVILGSIA